jgi:hypothetical protein
MLSVSLDSFKQLVRKLESTVKVKNPVAYYTGILNKKFQEVYFGELYEMGFKMGFLCPFKLFFIIRKCLQHDAL